METKNKINRKKEIIKNSIKLMYLKGYNATSVKEITDAAKIPKGSFYNYFKDKEDYALEALDYYNYDMVRESVLILTDKKLKPLTRIKEFFKDRIQFLKDEKFKYGCFVGNLTQEMGDVDELIAKKTSEISSELELTIYKNLVEAKESKDLKLEIDLKLLASTILSTWQGALVRMKMDSKKSVLDDFSKFLEEIL